ncbi:hypothetical protein [Haladaptatus caseinilyticus]|uniref:hypothetical protein n=1 Tax=Haladaptatus caseinilyticus TaxID=2993314 RepID=UPI00224AB68C|nr:hypothetical protein [Haladaptatus caseinilyticus]
MRPNGAGNDDPRPVVDYGLSLRAQNRPQGRLIDVPALDPLSPSEWVTEFLAAADEN